MDADEKARRSRLARALKSDLAVQSALERMRAAAIEQFTRSEPADDASRRDAYHRLRAVDEFAHNLALFIADEAVLIFDAKRAS